MNLFFVVTENDKEEQQWFIVACNDIEDVDEKIKKFCKDSIKLVYEIPRVKSFDSVYLLDQALKMVN